MIMSMRHLPSKWRTIQTISNHNRQIEGENNNNNEINEINKEEEIKEIIENEIKREEEERNKEINNNNGLGLGGGNNLRVIVTSERKG